MRKRTLANLSKLPDHAIDGLRILLKGYTEIPSLEDAFSIQRSLPHGHVAAVLETIENIGLKSLISEQSSRQRDLVSCHAFNLFVLRAGEQGAGEQGKGFDDFFPNLKIYSLNA